jgi:thiol-disulfide isomerase/thioredoxin
MRWTKRTTMEDSMTRPRFGSIVAVISTVLMLAGCGDEQPEAGGRSTSTQPPTATSSSQPADDAATGTQPPAVPVQLRFTANTVDGKQFSGESLAGKPAVLWFWAPWCPKCQAEAPTIAEAAKNATGVRFVGVAAQDEMPAMRNFVQRYDLGSFPHLADTDAAVWKRFGVTYQPAYAFVSSNGDIEMETAQLDEDELLARVGALR